MSSLSPSLGIPPIRSFDGYIRLTFDAFLSLSFRQKLAWEDEDLREELLSEGISANRAGYCEWATTDTLNPISVGWAWFCLQDGQIFLAPGGVSTNVMFVTPADRDVDKHRTSQMLCAWLASQNWQSCEIKPAV